MALIKSVINIETSLDKRELVAYSYKRRKEGVEPYPSIIRLGIEFDGESEFEVSVNEKDITFIAPESLLKNVTDGIIKRIIYLIDECGDRPIMLKILGVGTFDKILERFKTGKYIISRLDWEEYGRDILYREKVENISDNEINLKSWGLSDKSKITIPAFIQSREGYKQGFYNLTTEDIMADDWYIKRKID